MTTKIMIIMFFISIETNSGGYLEEHKILILKAEVIIARGLGNIIEINYNSGTGHRSFYNCFIQFLSENSQNLQLRE